jgi:hypothetical protein
VTGFRYHWTTKWIVLFLTVGLFCGGHSLLPRETNLDSLFKWAIKNYLEGKYREVIKDLELLLSYCSEDQKQLRGKIHLLMGAAHEQLGNPREARENYQSSLELLETYSIEGVDLTLLEEYQRIFMNKQKPVKPGIIVKPKEKPKKRKPAVLWLILGGVVIAGGAALLVLKKETTSGLPDQYTLTINIVGQGIVTIDPPGGTYGPRSVVILTAIPAAGWEFYNWYGDVTLLKNPTRIQMNSNKTVTAAFVDISGITRIFGHIMVFPAISTSRCRMAMPFNMPENGTIHSVTMYHSGGSGRMILAVYEGENMPRNRLSVTPETNVNSSDGWQTISLTSPVSVRGGQTVWLAWVYENNPGIATGFGSPSANSSNSGWEEGMPEQFGSINRAYNIYSIYATYIPN